MTKILKYAPLGNPKRDYKQDKFIISTFKIAGKGRSQEKKMAKAHIQSTFGLTCTEDEADAACIGLHYLKKQTAEFDWS